VAVFVSARVMMARTVPCVTWAAVAIFAVREPESRGALDGVVVVGVGVGFALALGGALDLAQDVGAQLVAGVLLGVGDRAEGGAGADRGAGGLGHALNEFVKAGRIVASLSGCLPLSFGTGFRPTPVEHWRHVA
jgi:hypothetical protein